MLINYDLLATLIEVGQTGSFAAAATRRHVTPSAISLQMKTLEGQLGFALFERIGRRSHLTDAGRKLLAASEAGFRSINDLLAELSLDSQAIRGTLRIGGPAPFSHLWLRPRLLDLLTRYPELRFDVTYELSKVLAHRLAAGDFDFCVLLRTWGARGLVTRPLFTEHFLAVASRTYLARTETPHSETDFLTHRFIVYDADLRMHDEWWRAHFGKPAQIPPRTAAMVANLREMVAMAQAGVGIAVLPHYVVGPEMSTGSLAAVVPWKPGTRLLSRAVPQNTIYLAWRRGAAETARFRAVKQAFGAGTD